MVVIEEIGAESDAKTKQDEKTKANPAKPREASASSAAAAPASAAAPATPPAPEFKLSQIIPLVAMFALQKFDLEKLGYVRYVEVGYIIVQVLCCVLFYFVYMGIMKMADDGIKIKIPEVKQLGQVVAPAQEQTAKEYDLDKLKEAVKQHVIGFFVLGGIYYKWGSLMPLVLQMLMSPMQLYEGPLSQIHLMGKKMSRPFPVANMFGLPSAPAAPAEDADKKND